MQIPGTGNGAVSSPHDDPVGEMRRSVGDVSEGAAKSLTRPVRITRLTSSGRTSCDDTLILEERFELLLNDRPLLALVCLPCDLDAFIVGLLFNEGILSDPHAIDLSVDRGSGRITARGPFAERAIDDFLSRRTLTSGCGSGVTGQDLKAPTQCLKIDTDFRVRWETISDFMRVLRDEASLYQSTGGAHIAALADGGGKLLLTAQDIGRHTAVDKVIGKALLSGIDHKRCVLFSSGRLSSEITAKAIHARTPVLVSRGAPTDLSVRLARQFLLTLVGFARGRRMNIYSVPERIID